MVAKQLKHIHDTAVVENGIPRIICALIEFADALVERLGEFQNGLAGYPPPMIDHLVPGDTDEPCGGNLDERATADLTQGGQKRVSGEFFG